MLSEIASNAKLRLQITLESVSIAKDFAGLAFSETHQSAHLAIKASFSINLLASNANKSIASIAVLLQKYASLAKRDFTLLTAHANLAWVKTVWHAISMGNAQNAQLDLHC